ncbi:uncharacterized protein LOC128993792 [Macrosteles quadrilineatus]|uniref:uncharacterized protein LOC128993792 n=1 Tax=Macrosteles quadrilineatus TaxID=74068 RepID=UPI0023E0EFE2|nr:uncharacterized protein LOC128993792 [Macrosteles quadrilineatus]
MLFPESVEDVCMIVETYGLLNEEVEDWIDSLDRYMDQLLASSQRLLAQKEDLCRYREEAEGYSQECRQLLQEVEVRVKYDQNLKVVVEFLAWECSLTAALAGELESQVEEMTKLYHAVHDHCDMIRDYRYLLGDYLRHEDEQRNYDQRSTCKDGY